MKRAALGGSLLLVAAQGAPEVPWWGHLIMALVSVALAFFSGTRSEAGRVVRR